MKILYYAAWLMCLTGALLAASTEDFARAIRANDLKALRQITKEDTASRDPLGWTPLHYAALYGSPEAVRIVLEAGADPNARNQSQVTPLIFGAYDFEKTRLMVEKGGDVNAKASDGTTPLWVAAGAQGNERTVRYLLEKGANAAELRPSGADYLMRAAGHEDAGVIRLLLQKGADPRRAAKDGTTALTESFSIGEHERTGILIGAGADANAANTTAGIVKNGPIDSFGITPLMLAAISGDPAQISALITAGANLNATDHRHMTALMMAVATDRANAVIVQRLIDGGADLNTGDRYGETALDWARKYRNPAVLAALEKGGAKGKGLPPEPKKPAEYQPDAREAVTRAVALLTKSTEEFFPAGGGVRGVPPSAAGRARFRRAEGRRAACGTATAQEPDERDGGRTAATDECGPPADGVGGHDRYLSLPAGRHGGNGRAWGRVHGFSGSLCGGNSGFLGRVECGGFAASAAGKRYHPDHAGGSGPEDLRVGGAARGV